MRVGRVSFGWSNSGGGVPCRLTLTYRTDQLDGETDWKLRVAVPGTQKMKDIGAIGRVMGEIYGLSPPSFFLI
jgi:hypothetical protein